TLNEDGNVNVRLAALDALRPYVRESNVREAIIRSIASQSSPMVQVALAELMVELQEKKSVKELRKLLEEEATPKDVKQRIEESIQVLI
ncbi:MAG TPA: HEAT repeat domain-containing protein, partial [Cyclobacteriaceae bacterium]|nr:HEAT repeat domain-containing protein [Cyclobacteriaceae bacterium]